MLDQTLKAEIKEANGDKFVFLRQVQKVAGEMDLPKFGDVLKNNSRAAVAVCLAATILANRWDLHRWAVEWARQVMSSWANCPRDTTVAVADIGLHPSRIEEYAGNFIRSSSV